MIIPLSELINIFEKLKKNKKNNKTIHIFPSIDCDSICSSKILIALCKNNGLKYAIQPVQGFRDLKKKVKKIKDSVIEKEIDNIIFINCMGRVNVLSYLFHNEIQINEDKWKNFNLFIFDYHRPLHPANVGSNQIVKIIDSEKKYNEFLLYENNQIEKDYYKGEACYGCCSSWFFYQIASSMDMADNSVLWYLIIGITKMFLEKQMHRDIYSRLINECHQLVLKSNNICTNISSLSNNLQTQRRKLNNIQFIKEVKLILLQQWSIYNSIYYSPILASKFLLWKNNGYRKIENFLMDMLVPLKEAHQDWISIDAGLQQKFYTKFIKYSINLSDDELIFSSFTKQHGDFPNLRVCDMIYALKALMIGKEVEDNEKITYDLISFNFKQSMDSLDITNQKILKRGFKLAKYIQKITIKKVFEIIKKNKIESCGQFYYTKIDEKTCFYTPLLIIKLSLSIQCISDQNKKSPKPLICSVWNYKRKTYTVYGLPIIEKSSLMKKNLFGKIFQKVAKKIHAKIQNISFETSLIEIQKDDWDAFMGKLFEIMMTEKKEELP